MQSQVQFPNIIDLPDKVILQQEGSWNALEQQGHDWVRHDVMVTTNIVNAKVEVSLLAETSPVSRIVLYWNRQAIPGARYLGDHWERGYGDLEWRGLVPERVLPWFFLASDGQRTRGYGVMTGAKAMCFWQVNERFISLCLDVRNGGSGVQLNGRKVLAATVVSGTGGEFDQPFQVMRSFCRQMSPAPLMPPEPVYGGNNWYYAYGKSSHDEILEDSRFMASLAPSGNLRPFMVIDDGWQLPRQTSEPDIWQSGNHKFPDMGNLASTMKAEGVRPGIWVRPLLAPDHTAASQCLPDQRFKSELHHRFLDPSLPETLERVRTDTARLAEWGYELIKHDYTTFDILGRWGFDMAANLTNEAWHFQDTSKTTAEIITGLYQVIRQAAGNSQIIGCNTVGHLAAGLVEMQRTGDDTSGRQWERTRKMGINTLAFTLPKHGAFFAVDADCAGITPDIPWALNRQWLDVLARSGTPLFVSASPSTGSAEKQAIREAFALAAKANWPTDWAADQATAGTAAGTAGVSAGGSQPDSRDEPLDWMDTTCPSRWRLRGEVKVYDWHRNDRID